MAATTITTNFRNFEQVAAAKQAQQEAGGLEGGPGEVKGFLLGRLLERKPELEQELLTFRDHLLAASSSSSDQTLKVTLLHCSHATVTACHCHPRLRNNKTRLCHLFYALVHGDA